MGKRVSFSSHVWHSKREMTHRRWLSVRCEQKACLELSYSKILTVILLHLFMFLDICNFLFFQNIFPKNVYLFAWQDLFGSIERNEQYTTHIHSFVAFLMGTTL